MLEYGEALALYGFKGDLPVELSFRKVGACWVPDRGAARCDLLRSLFRLAVCIYMSVTSWGASAQLLDWR